jgi:hypothetical protein
MEERKSTSPSGGGEEGGGRREKGGRREREGREKGGRRDGEGREKGGRREGEGREKGGGSSLTVSLYTQLQAERRSNDYIAGMKLRIKSTIFRSKCNSESEIVFVISLKPGEPVI